MINPNIKFQELISHPKRAYDELSEYKLSPMPRWLRAAELLLRSRKVTVVDGTILLADEETVDMHARTADDAIAETIRDGFARFTDIAYRYRLGAAMTYDYRRYNQYDILKPHWGFWLTLVFLARHVVGFVLVSMAGAAVGGNGGGAPKEAIDLGGLISLIDPIYMIADIPALVLLYALGSRVPKSGAAARWLWGAGRWLILASVAVYLALFTLTRGFDVAAFGWATWASLALNVLVIGYVLKSSYMRDMFAQYPPAEDGGGDG